MRQEPGTVAKDFRAQWYLTQAPKTRWGTPKPKGQGDWFGKEGVYMSEGGNVQSQQTQWHSMSQCSYS